MKIEPSSKLELQVHLIIVMPVISPLSVLIFSQQNLVMFLRMIPVVLIKVIQIMPLLLLLNKVSTSQLSAVIYMMQVMAYLPRH